MELDTSGMNSNSNNDSSRDKAEFSVVAGQSGVQNERRIYNRDMIQLILKGRGWNR